MIYSLLFICFFIAKNTFSQDSIDALFLAKKIFVEDASLQFASIGICVTDLKTKKELVSNNPKTALPPASTVKLFSTASAFEILGANYTPKTNLYSSSKVNNEGVLEGDLWIRGAGDISLGSRYYNNEGHESEFLEKWADSLYKLGLRKIKGNVIGDGSEFGYQGSPDGWNWADVGNYYGAGPSGLPIYDNILRFYLKLGGKVGSAAVLQKVFPEIENLNYVNYIEASKSRGDNSYIYGAPFSLDRFGTGYLPRNSSSFMVKGTLPDPEYQFACELKRIFQLRGITIEGIAKGVRAANLGPAKLRYKDKVLLYSHVGKSVNSIAWWTNMKSVNVFAEQLLCWIAKEKGSEGSTKVGTYIVERYWSGKIKDGGLNLKDGSGLSRSNAVTPENFCSLLQYMHDSKNAKLFKETMALAGETGTMSKVCYGQAGHGRIRAKSGTMNKIKAYAGYVESVNGKQLAFSIIVNNYSCSNDALLDKIEKFMNVMAKY